MAITKSTTLKRIEVKPAKNSGAGSDQNDKYPTLLIIYNDRMYDDENKITTDVQRVVNYSKYIRALELKWLHPPIIVQLFHY